MQGPRRFGRLLALLAFVSILTLAASPVGAVPPEREIFRESATIVLADCGGGVVLTESYTLVSTDTFFFDASGNLISVHVHDNFAGVITNSATGNTYNDPSHFTLIADFVEGGFAVHGMNFANTIPGVGIVVHETGTIIFDFDGNILFQAGPHEVTNGTAPDFCSIFV